MTTHVVADDVLGGIARKQWELGRRLMEGSLDPTVVSAGLQELIEGKYVLDDPFAYLSQYLLPIDEQLERIRHNNKMWGGCFTKKQLGKVDAEPRQEQSVTDLELFHVEGKTPGETMDMHWAAIAATQPNALRQGHLQADKIRLFDPTLVRIYAPGIHRIRINLTANWNGQLRNVEEVRARAAAGQLAGRSAGQLAHGETLSVFSSMPDLVPQMDGKKFPFMDLAGYKWVVGSAVEVPCFWWFRDDRKAWLGSLGAHHRDAERAAPLVIGES